MSPHFPALRARPRLPAVALLAAAALGGSLLSPGAHADDGRPPQGRTVRHPAPLDTGAPVAGARDPAPPGRSPQRELEELVRTPGGPPGAIAVLRWGDRTLVPRAGTADLATGQAPSVTDHMRLASVSKAYSGAVALQLVDRGLLRLDDTLGERLPSLPDAWSDVTLRQLLGHTSGLPDYSASQEFQDIVAANPHHRFDSRRLLDFVADEPLVFPPGSRYQYSNSDNIAVALMAEAVTGQRYETLLNQLVDSPLGLPETSLPQGFRLPRPYLHGYAVDPPNPPEDVSEALGTSGAWASRGIVSTPKDLTTFIRAYAGGALISDESRAQQFRFRPGGASEPAGPGDNAAGLAIFRYTTRCGTVYGHTGDFAGYTQLAVATADGERSLTFSITTQTSEAQTPDLLAQVRRVEEDFVCHLLRRRRAARAAGRPAGALSPPAALVAVRANPQGGRTRRAPDRPGTARGGPLT